MLVLRSQGSTAWRDPGLGFYGVSGFPGLRPWSFRFRGGGRFSFAFEGLERLCQGAG